MCSSDLPAQRDDARAGENPRHVIEEESACAERRRARQHEDGRRLGMLLVAQSHEQADPVGARIFRLHQKAVMHGDRSRLGTTARCGIRPRAVASADGVKISADERAALLAVPFPAGVSETNINRFIDRWNRTAAYNALGIFEIGRAHV